MAKENPIFPANKEKRLPWEPFNFYIFTLLHFYILPMQAVVPRVVAMAVRMVMSSSMAFFSSFFFMAYEC